MKLRQHRALRRLRFGLVLHAKATLGNVSKVTWSKVNVATEVCGMISDQVI